MTITARLHYAAGCDTKDERGYVCLLYEWTLRSIVQTNQMVNGRVGNFVTRRDCWSLVSTCQGLWRANGFSDSWIHHLKLAVLLILPASNKRSI